MNAETTEVAASSTELPENTDTTRPPYLGSQEAIMEKLREARLAGCGGITDRFYEAFAESIAGKPFNDVGLNMRWERVKDDMKGQMSAADSEMLDGRYDEVADLLAPNAELAAAAKAYRGDVKEALTGKKE